VYSGTMDYYKPSNTNHKAHKEKRLEPQEEYNLRKHIKLSSMQVDEEVIEPVPTVKKLKIKRQPLVID
ncbi:20174_t:CDS:1, partial [Dentiscutata erythropus]